MDIEEFERLVNGHDLTYSYSDDGSVYRNGAYQESCIREAAKQFHIEDVRRIWNTMVDNKLIESARKPFYWRE